MAPSEAFFSLPSRIRLNSESPCLYFKTPPATVFARLSSCLIYSVLASDASTLDANVPRDSTRASKTFREALAPPRHRYAAGTSPVLRGPGDREFPAACDCTAREALRKVRSQGNWRAPRVTVTRGLELRGPLPQERQVAPWAPSRAVGRGRRSGLRGHTETEARRRRRRGQRENEGHSPASAQSTPYTGSNRSPVARVRKREWREAFPLAEGAHEAGSRRPMSLSLCFCHLSGNGFFDFKAEAHRSVCGF